MDEWRLSSGNSSFILASLCLRKPSEKEFVMMRMSCKSEKWRAHTGNTSEPARGARASISRAPSRAAASCGRAE